MEDNKCSRCRHNTPEGVLVCDGCIHDQELKDRFEPMTNGDRIRGMTDEELAKILGCPYGMTVDCMASKPCDICISEYLRSPVESEGET